MIFRLPNTSQYGLWSPNEHGTTMTFWFHRTLMSSHVNIYIYREREICIYMYITIYRYLLYALIVHILYSTIDIDIHRSRFVESSARKWLKWLPLKQPGMLPRLVVVKSHGVVSGESHGMFIYNIHIISVFWFMCYVEKIYSFYMYAPSRWTLRLLPPKYARFLMFYFMDVEWCHCHWPGDVNVHSVGKLKKWAKSLPSCWYLR